MHRAEKDDWNSERNAEGFSYSARDGVVYKIKARYALEYKCNITEEDVSQHSHLVKVNILVYQVFSYADAHEDTMAALFCNELVGVPPEGIAEREPDDSETNGKEEWI